MGLTETAGSPKYLIDISGPGFFVSKTRRRCRTTILETGMPTFARTDSSLHWIRKADQQSHSLIELLDKAYVEAARGDDIENLGVLIDGLTDYATAHFYLIEHIMSTSMDLMERGVEHKAFAGKTISTSLYIMEHREEYKAFMAKVAELKNSYYCSEKPVSLKVLLFLTNWLSHYKLRVDPEWQFLSTSENQ